MVSRWVCGGYSSKGFRVKAEDGLCLKVFDPGKYFSQYQEFGMEPAVCLITSAYNRAIPCWAPFNGSCAIPCCVLLLLNLEKYSPGFQKFKPTLSILWVVGLPGLGLVSSIKAFIIHWSCAFWCWNYCL